MEWEWTLGVEWEWTLWVSGEVGIGISYTITESFAYQEYALSKVVLSLGRTRRMDCAFSLRS